MLLDELVADFARAVEDPDLAEQLMELTEMADVAEEAENAENAEDTEDAEDAVVMLAVADMLELAVTDSTVFELFTTKGALYFIELGSWWPSANISIV